MISPDSIEELLNGIQKDKSKFKGVLDKLLKFAVSTFNSVEELTEELNDLNDIYQTYIDDIDMQYWIKISDGKMEYSQGIREDASVRSWFTSDLIFDILKGKILGSEAYMKGEIKAHGGLTHGLRYIKLYRLFFKYIQAKYDIKGFPG